MQVTAVRSQVCIGIPSAGTLSHKHFLSLPNRFFSLPFFKRAADKCRARCWSVKSGGEDGDSSYADPIAPLEFESPVGKLLDQVSRTHPHLLPAAIDQQLENLQSDLDAKKESNPAPQDLLHKRIAEVKEKEKRNVLEEIIYFVIVQRFFDSQILMIPKIKATSDPTGRVDLWPKQEEKLESVHSPEAFEMIENHISIVIGDRLVGPLDTIVQISKIKLGKLYAASIMYGYFLRRVDQRYQLERTMKALSENAKEEQVGFVDPTPTSLWDPDSLIRIRPDDGDDDYREGSVESKEEKSFRLRSYVMHLDSDTLQRYATIRSKEAISLIEKQTQALFGRPDIKILEDGSLDTSSDEVVSMTFAGFTMLILEAVAFGSFLWDSESYVEAKYPFIKS